MTDQVDQIVIDARNSGNSVAMEAGREASLAIANAQNAYSESLNETVDKLDPRIKDTTDKLQSLVNDISSGAITTVDLATTRTQAIVNTIPFANKELQVTNISPQFVVPSESVPVHIQFHGNFPSSSLAGFAPYLLIGGKRYSGQNGTQDLSFLIPAGNIFKQASDSVQFTQVSLVTPWQADKYFGLRHVRREDNFNIYIGALPSSPGQLTLIHTENLTVPETKVYTSGPFHQASTKEAGNNDDKNHPYLVTPDTGWHVVRNTSNFVIFSSQGDQSHSFVSDDADRVQYNVTTIHHGAGSSGSIDFRITFTESTTQTQSVSKTESMSLNWGDSKAFNYPAGSWKLVFTSFDGRHFEMTGSENDNPFITIANQEGSMVVSAKNPAVVNWP